MPTAVAGCTPNSRISSGVINEPPPIPVIPTSRPTQKPDSEYSGSIGAKESSNLFYDLSDLDHIDQSIR